MLVSYKLNKGINKINFQISFQDKIVSAHQHFNEKFLIKIKTLDF